ncbi:hypothetical protein NDU88_002233 [Pleurodeles waltl]|uniref:Uncharacterized protein n=1 Tax=Pleurodeles waltl TaxID=8319 RepID=A0AAV7UWI9_PLEWA|nr:hypothetical protein NDU88_002233 [Pleurodeles waltl]
MKHLSTRAGLLAQDVCHQQVTSNTSTQHSAVTKELLTQAACQAACLPAYQEDFPDSLPKPTLYTDWKVEPLTKSTPSHPVSLHNNQVAIPQDEGLPKKPAWSLSPEIIIVSKSAFPPLKRPSAAMEETSLKAAGNTALFSPHCAHSQFDGDNDTIIQPGALNIEPDYVVILEKPTAHKTIPSALPNREHQEKLEDQYIGDEEIFYVMYLTASWSRIKTIRTHLDATKSHWPLAGTNLPGQ